MTADRSKKHEMAYRTIQGFTLLGGGLLWYALNQTHVRYLEPNPEVVWALVQCVKFLSGLGSVAALLSLMVPPIGRPVLRGYYAFFFLLFGLTGLFSILDVLTNQPLELLVIIPPFALILGILTVILDTLAPAKEKEVFAEA